MEFHNHLKLSSILRYITLILFLACTARADSELVPNYDDPGQKIKFFDVRIVKPLLLSCEVPNNGNHKLVWSKNGVEVLKIKELEGHIQIHDKENKLIIPKPTIKDAGNYTCSIPELKLSAEIRAVANVYFGKVPDNLSVVEGEKLRIHCKAYGSEPITIKWIINGSEEFDRSRVILKADDDDIADAILTIENVLTTDRVMYNCSAENLATKFNSTIYPPAQESAYVRVKGKLAALWPFLGICAEVFILCAIILVYEKRRNKEGLDESDTDQSPEQEKLKTGK